MDCWRISSRLVAALVLTIGPLACGGARNEVAPGGEGGKRRRRRAKTTINAMPRDRVQDGGRLTWPIESMPVTYNYSHLDGTDATTRIEASVDAADLSRGCRRHADLESGLPGIRARRW